MKTTKFRRILPAIGVCTILTAIGEVQAALTITGDTADSQIITTNAGDTGGASNYTQPAIDPMRVGRNTGSQNRTVVFVFQLPNLGAVANPFQTSSLTFNLNSIDGTTNYEVDLYGLAARATAAVNTADFYMSTTTDPSTSATKLESGILTSSSTVGATTSSDITTWLNGQYAAGAGADQYVFLRLSAAVNSNTFNSTNGYTVASANAGSNTPFITYTIPEPSSSALVAGAFGFLVLLRRRNS